MSEASNIDSLDLGVLRHRAREGLRQIRARVTGETFEPRPSPAPRPRHQQVPVEPQPPTLTEDCSAARSRRSGFRASLAAARAVCADRARERLAAENRAREEMLAPQRPAADAALEEATAAHAAALASHEHAGAAHQQARRDLDAAKADLELALAGEEEAIRAAVADGVVPDLSRHQRSIGKTREKIASIERCHPAFAAAAAAASTAYLDARRAMDKAAFEVERRRPLDVEALRRRLAG